MVDSSARWIVAPSADAARTEAAQVVAAALVECSRHRDRPRLAIPGGSAAACLNRVRATLRSTPQWTSSLSFSAAHDLWSRVLLTWVDERCVPYASEDSNRGAAYRDGHLSIEDPCAAEVPLWTDEDERNGPPAALARFEAHWRDVFEGSLDVVLLGMGPDGHVASLFPGREPDSGIVAYVEDSPKPPPRRMTMTRAALSTADATVLLACGREKRTALHRLAKGDPDLPASRSLGLVVVTDQRMGAMD